MEGIRMDACPTSTHWWRYREKEVEEEKAAAALTLGARMLHVLYKYKELMKKK